MFHPCISDKMLRGFVLVQLLSLLTLYNPADHFVCKLVKLSYICYTKELDLQTSSQVKSHSIASQYVQKFAFLKINKDNYIKKSSPMKQHQQKRVLR